AAPPAHVFEPQQHERQESEHDQKELEHFVVDCRGEAAEHDVDEDRSEEHTSELQSLRHLVCRLLLEKKKKKKKQIHIEKYKRKHKPRLDHDLTHRHSHIICIYQHSFALLYLARNYTRITEKCGEARS